MSDERTPQVLRLRKRHAPRAHTPASADDGRRILAAQSLWQASIAALLSGIVFAILWAMFTLAIGRVLPWMTLVLGMLTGFAVRRAGQGVDWRFPLLAAAFTFIGAIGANVVVAAALTAADYDTGTLQILQAVTSFTWPVFFDEVMTAADFVYAAFAAGIAAWYANRRLNRREFQAVRLYEEQRDANRNDNGQD